VTATLLEREELDRLRPKLEGDGFQIIEEPKIRFPEALRSYRPDFLAKRGDEYLAIEIKQKRTAASTAAINRLERVFANVPNWTLYVHFVDKDNVGAGLKSQNAQTIREGFQEVRNAISHRNLRSAFLLSCASFEAAGRALHSRIFSKPQSPGRVITVLAERGYLEPQSAEALRKAAAKRNALIHGELDADISIDDVELVLAEAGKLLSFVEVDKKQA